MVDFHEAIEIPRNWHTLAWGDLGVPFASQLFLHMGDSFVAALLAGLGDAQRRHTNSWGFTQRSFPKRDKAELWVESPEQKWSFHSFRCTDFLSSTHSRNVESDAKADFCARLFRTLGRCVWTPEHSLEMQREHELKIAKASGEHYVYLLWDGMLAMFHFCIFRKSLKPSERCDRAWDPFMLFFLLSEWSWLQHLISYRSNDASSPSFLICPIKMKNEEIRDCCTFPLSMTLRALPWLCVGDMPLGSSQSL